MKKIYLAFLAVFLGSVTLVAQTVLITDDFEAYTTGTGIAAQAGAPWGTWSGATGGSEDPLVSNAQAYAGTNSINVIANNDLVLDLGGKTTGRYQIAFYMYVNSGAVGYINLLSNFAGASSEWATQTFFNADGTGTVDADGESAGTFNYTQAQWLYVNYIVDIDDDFVTLYIDGTEVISWQYTKGSFGDGCAPVLDALNIFGWTSDTGTGSNFYVDDLSFTEMLTIDAPGNLVATVTGSDIQTTWEAPASGTPDSYLLMSNGNVIASGITDLFYDQSNVYPGTYLYKVRAHFDGLGYSPSSNEASGTVDGGVTRNLTLLEISTGTWCTYCPGAAMGADDMTENGHEVAIIEYHNGDPYATADCLSREAYYSVDGWPTSVMDGVLKSVGGSSTTSLYPSYLSWFNQRYSIPSVYNMDLNIVMTGANTFTATVDIEEVTSYFASGMVLRAVLTESYIPEVWMGMTEVNFVCRQMFPNHDGFPLDFSSFSTHSENIDFSTSAYVKDNCEFVVFLQHEVTKEVVQVAKIDMETIVGINNIENNKISVYPNPASDYINVFTDGCGIVEIYNVTGELILQQNISSSSQRINIEGLSLGMYVVKVKTLSSSFTEKLIVK